MASNEIKKRRVDRAVNIAKGIAGIVVPLGVGAVTKSFTSTVKPGVDAKTLNRVLFGIGEYFISGMIAYKTVENAEQQLDEIGAMTKNIIDAADGVEITEKEDQ